MNWILYLFEHWGKQTILISFFHPEKLVGFLKSRRIPCNFLALAQLKSLIPIVDPFFKMHIEKFRSFFIFFLFLHFSFRLLHSKSKESDVQLKSLLDESIRQRKAGLPINIPIPKLQEVTTASGSNVKGRETEKNLDRLKRDLNVILPPGTYF